MRKILSAIIIGSLLFTFYTPTWAFEEPDKGNEGVWVKKYHMKGVDKKWYYSVDTVTQLCFAFIRVGTGSGLTEISCKKLKRRPEWKNIIVWD